MKRLFTFLVILVLCVAAIGFYRNWFTVSSASSDTNNHKVDVKLTVDPDKIEADADAVKEKAQELTGDAKDKVDQLVQPETEPSNSK
ncbi:MAG: hypothetical protein RIK87_18845 [Fuerstiella sp.]